MNVGQKYLDIASRGKDVTENSFYRIFAMKIYLNKHFS